MRVNYLAFSPAATLGRRARCQPVTPVAGSRLLRLIEERRCKHRVDAIRDCLGRISSTPPPGGPPAGFRGEER